VDEVEVIRWPCPIELGVVDVKFAVWGYPGWLDGRDVDADYLSCRKLVGDVDGPDSSAGTNVEDSLGFVADRGAVELVIEKECHPVMGDIEAFILLLVVGAPVVGFLGEGAALDAAIVID